MRRLTIEEVNSNTRRLSKSSVSDRINSVDSRRSSLFERWSSISDRRTPLEWDDEWDTNIGEARNGGWTYDN
jgi:hypothetical protein